VYLRYYLHTGEWPDTDAKRTGFDPERETYYRLSSSTSRISWASTSARQVNPPRDRRTILRSLNRGNRLPLDAFAKKSCTRAADVEDFERYIRHELGMQQLAEVTGLGGALVTPQEAQTLYEREHQN